MQALEEVSRVVEDHRARSNFMRGLVLEALTVRMQPDASQRIPQVLVQFWHDRSAIPLDVRECMASWAPVSKGVGLTRLLFDDGSARKLISRAFGPNELAAFDRCPHPAMRSDYFRLCYLHERGGFYVDADDVYRGGDLSERFRGNGLKLQPLCYDA